MNRPKFVKGTTRERKRHRWTDWCGVKLVFGQSEPNQARPTFNISFESIRQTELDSGVDSVVLSVDAAIEIEIRNSIRDPVDFATALGRRKGYLYFRPLRHFTGNFQCSYLP